MAALGRGPDRVNRVGSPSRRSASVDRDPRITKGATSEMRINAASTHLSRIVAGPAASGSAAQQAFDKAVKHLTEAQKKLAQDAANHAPDDTLKVDQSMVEMATMAVAAAAAALAREQDQGHIPAAPPAAVLDPGRNPDQRRKGEVDVYA
ncbi:MAG: hypothetical protein ACOH2F_20320 [Cellulomonas sp.]